MEFSSNGGTSYTPYVAYNMIQLTYATRASYAGSGILKMVKDLYPGGVYGCQASGFIKLMNPSAGSDRSFSAFGQSAHHDNGNNQIMTLYSATGDTSGATSQPVINAFKIKMDGSTLMVKGTISVFGVTNS
jgi:hypothetical protein